MNFELIMCFNFKPRDTLFADKSNWENVFVTLYVVMAICVLLELRAV